MKKIFLVLGFLFVLVSCGKLDPIQPDKINIIVHGGSGSGEYDVNDEITIVADVLDGKIFSKWMAGTTVLSTTESYTFIATTDLEIVANYTLIDYTATFKLPVNGYQGNSLEFKYKATNSNTGDVDFVFKNDATALTNWTGAEELWFYVNASEFRDKTPSIRVGFETTDTNGSRVANRLAEGSESYFIKDKTNTREILTADANGFITLPEHFAGWISIPLNYPTLVKYWTSGPSLDVLSLQDVHQFMISVQASEAGVGSSIYFDGFGFVGTDVQGNQMPIIISGYENYEYVQAWSFDNLVGEAPLDGILIDWLGVQNFYEINIFKSSNEIVEEIIFNVDTVDVTEPLIPEKIGYSSSWESYTLETRNIVIYACYTPIVYTASFVVDGQIVSEVPFDITTGSVEEPIIPEKNGYETKWEAYELKDSNIIVNAVYTPIEYTATFKSEAYQGISYGYQGNSLEYYHAAINPPLGDLDYVFRNDSTAKTDWTDAEELWVYVNASNFNDLTPEIRVNYQSKDSNGVLTANRIKYGATYYLVEKDGTERIAYTASEDGFIKLPYKFEGWLNIPLNVETLECYWASGERTGEIVLNDVHQFMVTINGDQDSVGSYLYLDAFGFIGTTVNGENLPVNLTELTGYTYVQAWDFENLGYENSLNGIRNDFFGTLNYYNVKVVGLEANVVKRVGFTMKTTSLEPLEVPLKEGFIGTWENYTLGTTDLTINAVYTPDPSYIPEYTATFMADGNIVEVIPFKSTTNALIEPSVPVKNGYTGAWETYTLANSDLTINAIYTLIEYNAIFKTPGNGYTGNALEFYRYATHEGGFGDIDFAFKNDPTAITNWTGAEELWVFVNASKFADSTPQLRINFQFVDSNGVLVATRIKLDANYYLIEKNSNTRTSYLALADGYVTLPNQFEGWLCIPLTKESLDFYWSTGTRTGELVLSDVNQFMITVNGDNTSVGSYFYLDAFGFVGSTVNGKPLPEDIVELAGYQYVEAWGFENLGAVDSLNGIMNDFFGSLNFYQVKVQSSEETVETVKFTVETLNLIEPLIPERLGYTGTWEPYNLDTQDIVIYAEYVPKEYTATFLADDTVVSTVPFTVRDLHIVEPVAPEKAGYTVHWEPYTIGPNNMTVNAVYTLIEYTATFVAEGYPGISYGYSGNSLEFTRIANHDDVFFDLDFVYKNDSTSITDWTGAEELWVYVNASKFNEATPKFRVNFQFTDSNGVSVATRVKFGATFYIIEKDGTVRISQTAQGDGYLGIPSKFEGWVCVPLDKNSLESYWSSGVATGEIVLTDVNQFMISVYGSDTSVGSSFYIDAIGFIGTTVTGNSIPANIVELSSYQFVEAWDFENLGTEGSLNGIMNDFFGTLNYYSVKVVGLEATVVEREKFTVETTMILEPLVPEKAGFTGSWEAYTLTNGSLTINAIYTPL